QLRSRPQRERITHRLGSGDQKELAGFLGHGVDSPNKSLLDSAWKPQRLRLQQSESPSQLRCRQSPWPPEKRKWIPTRLRNDSVTHLVVEPESHRGAQQPTCIAVPQAT